MDLAEPKLITGAPAQLEQALADGVREAQAGDPLRPVAVLLGGTLQRPYLQRRLAELNGGIAGVRFLMPSELAMELGEPALATAGERPLPPLADRILLRSVAAAADGYFEPVRATPGLASALARLVRELRGAGYDALSFGSALAGACEVAEKEQALSEIFSRFLERRAGFFGPDDAMLAADPARARFGALFIYGIWSTLPALGSLIGRLAAQMPATALLPVTGIEEVDDAHAELRRTLAGAGFELTQLDPEAGDGSALAHVRGTIFDPVARPAPQLDATVSLLSGSDPTHEVRAVARRCLAWAREGIGFHEMAIAYRNPNPYRAAIESVMIEAGIPVYLHEGTPLAERPLGRRVLALVDLTESEFERRAVMDFLSDGKLPEATRERYDRPSISRWDRFSRKAGVVRGLDQWQARLEAHKQGLRASEREWDRADAEQVEHLQRFIADLGAALDSLPKEGLWSEHLDSFARLLDDYVEDPEPLLDALEALTRFDALGETASLERFRETIRSTIENLRNDEIEGGRAGAFGLRGVNVIDVSSLRHVRFRAVAIVGVAERSFPSPPSPDPILLDHERERLNAQGPAPIPLRARGADPEPLQFALAVNAARERLVVSYARKGSTDSRPQLPSRFFRAVAEAAVGGRVRAQHVDRLPTELYERVSGSRVGADGLDAALSIDEYDRTLIEADADLARAALGRAEPRIARGWEAWRSRFSPQLTEFDGLLSEAGREALARTFDFAGGVSPSTLETYVACPQKVFAGNVLRAREDEEPEDVVSLSPLDRGTLLHRVMERFLSEEPAGGGELLHGEGELERLRTIAAEEFEAAETRGITGYPTAWAATKLELLEDLQAWFELERDDPSFRVLSEGAYEVSFGLTHGEPSAGDRGFSQPEPLAITAGGVELQISGRIDRLNWNPERTRFRITDYKTGRSDKAPKPGSLGGAGSLQLPIYLLAAARLLEIDATAGGAEYYYSTRLGRFRHIEFSGDDLRDRRADLEHVLESIVSGMTRGIFHIAPKGPGECRWCDYNGICPTGRFKLIERKKAAPAAAAHAKLREIE